MVNSRRFPPLAILILSDAASAAEPQSPPDKDALLCDALSAAPPDVAKNATVTDWKHNTLQKGGNGYTCFSDAPHTPRRTHTSWCRWSSASRERIRAACNRLCAGSAHG